VHITSGNLNRREGGWLTASVRIVMAMLIAFAALVASGSMATAKNTDPPKPPPGPPIEFSPIAGATPPPELDAYAWIIADAQSGEILAAKGSRHRLPQASTTKALTALTVIPHLDPNSTYVGRKQDAKADGSQVGIQPGASYTVMDLLHGLMLPSGNDAASALANANGGWDKTIAEMNAEAAKLGANDTVIRNPSGLDSDGHVSTALDEVTIFRAGLQLPLFRQLVGTRTAQFPGEMPAPGKKRESFAIANQDRLLMNRYPGIIGGKTGYTTNAGRTFVGAAERNGHTLLISIMRTEQHLDEAGAKLLDWGFANLGRVNPLGTLPQPGQSADETAQVAKSAQSGTSAGVGTPDTNPATGTAADTQVLAASVTNQSTSTSDLPWLMYALVAFLAVLIVASILRARVLIRKGK